MKSIIFIFVALPQLILAAETNALNIIAGVPPHAWLASQIAPKGSTSSSIVTPGTDPHSYEPTAKQISAIYNADVIIASGVPFEQRIHEKLPAKTRNRILLLETDDHTHHEDEPHHEGEQHSWLSPSELRLQAALISEKMMQMRPDQQEQIAKNLTKLDKTIQALQTRLEKVLADCKGKRVYVFHPCLDALAEEYHFKQVAIEHEGKRPSPKRLRRIINQAKTDKITIILVNPQFDKKSAAATARSIGAKVVEFDPLAPNPLKNIERIANIIAGTELP